MRISEVRVKGYRCIDDLTIELDDLTVLIGANGAGKSSLLYALEWFFTGGPLEVEDICGQVADATISVSATFTDFTGADREVLGRYLIDERATFWRTWSLEGGEKLTGRGLAFPPFEAIRAHTGATALRDAYKTLGTEHPDLALPSVGSKDKALQAMVAWEEANPNRREDATVSATHLFGFTGGPRLAGRFDFVLVPAVADAEQETRDGRGTLLRQLLDRSTADQESIDRRIATVAEHLGEEVEKIIEEEHRPALETIATRVSAELARLVEGGTVALDIATPQLKVPALQVGMRVADQGVETDVGRQGHGFQRALMISIVQELARADENHEASDAPALFLAMEEPELYQHPLQARHFSTVLADLPRGGEAAIQVAYATHNEHFVEPTPFERLRRFQKKRGAQSFPTAVAVSALSDDVAARLQGVVDPKQIPRRIKITLRRMIAEAVFARAVILTEGYSDVALLAGFADRSGGGLDAEGIAVVPASGKSSLLLPWAILTELEIPVFVLFDGDSGSPQRLLDKGCTSADVENERSSLAAQNRQILSLLGGEPEDFPTTQVGVNFAVFEDHLETTLTELWPAARDLAKQFADEVQDWRSKPDDALREAARTADDPPEFLEELVAAVRALL